MNLMSLCRYQEGQNTSWTLHWLFSREWVSRPQQQNDCRDGTFVVLGRKPLQQHDFARCKIISGLNSLHRPLKCSKCGSSCGLINQPNLGFSWQEKFFKDEHTVYILCTYICKQHNCKLPKTWGVNHCNTQKDIQQNDSTDTMNRHPKKIYNSLPGVYNECLFNRQAAKQPLQDL